MAVRTAPRPGLLSAGSTGSGDQAGIVSWRFDPVEFLGGGRPRVWRTIATLATWSRPPCVSRTSHLGNEHRRVQRSSALLGRERKSLLPYSARHTANRWHLQYSLSLLIRSPSRSSAANLLPRRPRRNDHQDLPRRCNSRTRAGRPKIPSPESGRTNPQGPTLCRNAL